MGEDREERKCRMCTMEERIRELEEGSGNRQIGQFMLEIEERIEKAKRQLAEFELRLEGALGSCGSLGNDLQKLAKEESEIKMAISSFEFELGIEKETGGTEAEWVQIGKGGKQQKQRRGSSTEGRTEAVQDGEQGMKAQSTRDGGKYSAIPQTQELVVIGDSIARGIGARLQEQHGRVRVFAKGGGTLVDAERKAEEISLTGEEAIVVITGGNDIDRGDGTEEVMEGYKRMVATLRKRGVEKITLVGPSTRRHFSAYFNSKAIGINQRLERWSAKEGFNFVKGGVSEKDKIRLLARDGVLFTREGEDSMVRKIYQSTRQYLNKLVGRGVEEE